MEFSTADSDGFPPSPHKKQSEPSAQVILQTAKTNVIHENILYELSKQGKEGEKRLPNIFSFIKILRFFSSLPSITHSGAIIHPVMTIIFLINQTVLLICACMIGIQTASSPGLEKLQRFALKITGTVNSMCFKC